MKNIICIAREYGSGGREIGERLAQELAIPCYDKLLLTKISEHYGISEDKLKATDEQPISYNTLITGNVFADLAGIRDAFYFENVGTYALEKEMILKLADEGPCIMIGRCAASILEEREDVLSVFIQAKKEDRIKRIMGRNHMDEKVAAKRMKEIDKCRAYYHNFYCDDKWGDRKSYDLVVDSSVFGIKGCCDIIKDCMNR